MNTYCRNVGKAAYNIVFHFWPDRWAWSDAMDGLIELGNIVVMLLVKLLMMIFLPISAAIVGWLMMKDDEMHNTIAIQQEEVRRRTLQRLEEAKENY